MAQVVNNADSNKKIGGVTGKGFVKGDPRINRKGAPRRGQTWQEAVKRITDMTREEAIAYVGPTSKIGKQLKELSPEMPLKDAIIFATIIAYGREPNARMLSALMDREDGKPKETVDLSNSDGTLKPESMSPSEILARADALRKQLKDSDANSG